MSLDAFSLVIQASTSDEVREALQAQAGDWLARGRPSLALVFITYHHEAEFPEILEAIHQVSGAHEMAGCSAGTVIASGKEYEEEPGISLFFLRHPALEITVSVVNQALVESSTGPSYWHQETDCFPTDVSGLLLFGDPFTANLEKAITQLGEAYPQACVVGGLAVGDPSQRETSLFHGHQILNDGMLALFLKGPIRMESIISQGCTPIGDPLIVTRGEKNALYELGGKRSIDALAETIAGLSQEERDRLHGNLFLGVVLNEYVEEFKRGDFLIRNLMGADPDSGALYVAANVRVGQTIQFQLRDADSAHEDMEELLEKCRHKMGHKPVAALIFSCNGRGSNLFGEPHHDAALVEEQFGKIPAAGFFCNGEIGRVGPRLFLHGYTCAMALFLDA